MSNVRTRSSTILDHAMKYNTHPLFWILSPTYKLAELNKRKWLAGDNGQQRLTDEIKKHNLNCLAITLFFATVAGLIFKQDFYANDDYKCITYFFVSLYVWLFFFSRGYEIFKAFLDDAVEKLNGTPSTRSLNYGDRLRLAFNSYIELMVGFGVLYYVLPSSFFKGGASGFQFANIVEAIYFSGITMATVGYGDISPASWFTQTLVVFQVFCSLTLALVSFTVYTSLALASSNPAVQGTPRDKAAPHPWP
jgi:voltage-gated potassium channel